MTGTKFFFLPLRLLNRKGRTETFLLSRGFMIQ